VFPILKTPFISTLRLETDPPMPFWKNAKWIFQSVQTLKVEMENEQNELLSISHKKQCSRFGD